MEQCKLNPAQLKRNADFDPQNHGDIVSGTKTTTKNYIKNRFSLQKKLFCKPLLLQQVIQAL